MNRGNYIRIVTSVVLVVSLLAPLVIKSFLVQAERLSGVSGFNKPSTSKTDIQFLCEEKEKEEEFGTGNFHGAILATGLIVDLTHFCFLDDQNSGFVITKSLMRATPLYLLQQTLLI